MKDAAGNLIPGTEETLDNDDTDGAKSAVIEVADPRQAALDRIMARHETNTAEQILEGGGTVEPLHTEGENPDEIADELEITIPLDEIEVSDEVIADDSDAQPELGDFVEVVGGVPSLKMVVDGETQFVPLSEVQTSQQVRKAGQQRLQEATDWSKDLATRESNLQQREAAVTTREAAEQSSPPDSSGADDQGTSVTFEDTQEIVQSLLHGTADEAATKLHDVLGNRISTTPVNTSTIAKEAAQVAKDEIRQEDWQDGLRDGLKTFKETYPDIANDEVLYNVTNSKTPKIAKDNPTWNPEQVMLEAGRQVKKWDDDRRSGEVKKDPPDDTSELVNLDTNDRQARKEGLVPMPESKAAIQEKPEEQPEQTPGSYLDEVRAARGQV